VVDITLDGAAGTQRRSRLRRARFAVLAQICVLTRWRFRESEAAPSQSSELTMAPVLPAAAFRT
jgi:hypothetical protein